MRKVGIVLIVCLLAVAGITAAMAYNSAEVHNPMSVEVSASNEALLAMLPGDFGVAEINDATGKLEIDMGPFQPGAKYTYEKAFSVENKAGIDIDAWYELSDEVKAIQDKHGPFITVRMWNPAQTGPEGATPWTVRHITPEGHPAGSVRHVTLIFDFIDMSEESYNQFKGVNDGFFVVYAEEQ